MHTVMSKIPQSPPHVPCTHIPFPPRILASAAGCLYLTDKHFFKVLFNIIEIKAEMINFCKATGFLL